MSIPIVTSSMYQSEYFGEKSQQFNLVALMMSLQCLQLSVISLGVVWVWFDHVISMDVV